MIEPSTPAVQAGDVLSGTIVDLDRGTAIVQLDAFPAGPPGVIYSSDMSWAFGIAQNPEVGQHITAQMLATGDPIRLARTATEHPALWTFLKSLQPKQVLTGVIAAIESFGVFIALDDGPSHPVFPGVGFVTHPELSWTRNATVHIGQRVSGQFLEFDTHNGEARMSLKALLPDPFLAFADQVQVGEVLVGTVTERFAIGTFVCVTAGFEGLIPWEEMPDSLQTGQQVGVIVTEVDRTRRRIRLAPA